MIKIWWKSIQIDSAVMNLRMREKNLRVDFLVNLSVHLSIYPSVPFFVGATGHMLTHNGSNDVFSQPLVPLGGLDDTF